MAERDSDTTQSSALAETAPLAETAAGGASASGSDHLAEVSPDRYRIAGEVGRGGLGRVVEARDRLLDRTVAIKELRSDDADLRRRFVREALVTARLQHPSIVPVYEAGRWPDQAPFYAMRLVAGQPFAKVLDVCTTLEHRLAHIPTVLAVADAIAYAHDQRIVHRDLKPHNVMVGDYGETIVIDWGLAKDLAAGAGADDEDGPYRAVSADQTVVGAVLGTPHYMAPEQAVGDSVDERADVYAIGAILYHVIAGAPPHEGATVDDLLAAAIAGRIRPLAEREPRAPTDLVAIVTKAMAHDPQLRYPSARQLAVDLRRFTTGQLVGARRYTRAARVARWLRRHRAIALVTSIALTILAGYGAWSIRRIGIERDRAVERADRAVVAQARDALARDPAEALAWLGRLSPASVRWTAARAIAADALLRPLPTTILDGIPATAIATLSADRRFVVAADGRTVTIVEVATGGSRTVTPPEGLDGFVRPCDDARVLVEGAAGDDRRLVTIELATGATSSAPFTETGKDAATRACTSRGLEWDVWWDPDFDTPRRLLVPNPSPGAPPQPPSWVRLSPDRTHAVGHHHDAVIRWDRGDGFQSIAPVAVSGAHIIDTSADGNVGATLDPAPLTWDFARAAQQPLAPTGTATAFEVASDGSWIAIADAAGIELFRPDTGARFDLLETRGAIDRLLTSDDGRWLAATGVLPTGRSLLQVWDLRGARRPFVLTGHAKAEILFGAGDRIITVGGGTLRTWDLVEPTVAFPFAADAAELSPNGRFAIARAGSQLVRVDRDQPARVERASLEVDPAREVVLSIGDRGDAIAGERAQVWTWPRDGVLERVSVPAGVAEVVAVVAASDGTVLSEHAGEVLEWRGSQLVSRYGEPRSTTFAMEALERSVMSADGRMIAISDSALLVDRGARSATRIPTWWGSQLALSADGAMLATGVQGTAGAVQGAALWTGAGTLVREVELPILADFAAFSPDGTRVVFGGEGPMAVHTIAAGTTSLVGDEAALTSIGFLANEQVVTTNLRATARIWDLPTATAIDIDGERILARRVIEGRLHVLGVHGLRTIANPFAHGPAWLDQQIARFAFAHEGDRARVITTE